MGLLEFFNGTVFQSISPSNSLTYTVDNFTGDGSTTSFNMSIAESNEQQIIVFVGSIYQDPDTAYTVNGTVTITFTSPPPADEPISVIHSTT
jgi:stress response protein SCP2